jgi:flagellar basal-body rod modification protein FlgD
MLNLAPVTPSSNGMFAAGTSQQEKKNTEVMGKDAFLMLLIEQLKNQDPLDPMDSTDFTAQLAQFSSLEQLSNINSNLESLQEYSANMNRLNSLGMIGKEITYVGSAGHVSLGDAGEPVTLEFSLADDAAQATVTIMNETGQEVARLDLGAQDAGQQQVSWDGKDAAGKPLPAGNYHFEVAAIDELHNSVAVTLFGSALVKGIATDNDTGATMVVTAFGQVPIADIVGVRER